MIFLSYSSKDKERVRPIAESLSASGYDVWWDEEIPAGSRFEKEIEAKLKLCGAVIVLWSLASIDSEWVYEEADFGKRRSKLVPVFLDDCTPPMGFRMREGARLETWNGDATHIEWQGLLRSLEPLLGVPERHEASSRPAHAHSEATHHPSQDSDESLDLRYDLSLSLEEAYFGKTVEVELPDIVGEDIRQISVNVPAGIESGSMLRLRGLGSINESTGENGDLYFICDIADHPVFERQDDDLYFSQSVNLSVAILGGEVDINMIDGSKIRVKIPPGTQPTALLRLKGKGMPNITGQSRGDAYLQIQVEIPRHLTEKGRELINDFAKEEQAARFEEQDIFNSMFSEIFGKGDGDPENSDSGHSPQ